MIVGLSACRSNAAKDGVPDANDSGLLDTGPGPALLAAQWSVTGTPADGFARAVSAGDVNGDGYDDLIGGAQTWHEGGHENDEIGRAYVFEGSAVGVESAPTTLLYADSGYHFGASAEGIGDINADGYSDVMVGGFDDAYGGVQRLFLGSPDGIVESPAATYTGYAAQAAGDVDGDGVDDVLIESDYWIWDLHFGSPGGVVSEAASTVEEGGVCHCVVSNLDVDGDGYDDVVARTGFEDAVLWAGGPGGLLLGPTVALPEGDLWSAGDVNGDGFDDFGVVGQPNVYVYEGSAGGLPADAATTLMNASDTDFAGFAAGVGDVNGDGFGDVVVTDDYGDPNYVYLGSTAGLPSASSAVVLTTNRGYDLGVYPAGDTNGDGYDDFVIGNGNFAARQDVHLGAPDGPEASASVVLVGQEDDRVGLGISGAGDMDGDGYDDLVLGVFGDDGAIGAVWIYDGSATGPGEAPSLTLAGSDFEAWFGYSVAGAGDVNADGFDDVVVGNLSSPEDGVSVVFGAASGVDRPASIRIAASEDEVHFGEAVAGLGDVDGDTYDDFAIGNVWPESCTSWRVYVESGAADGVAGSTLLTAPVEGSNCSSAGSAAVSLVAGVGDLDGDGLDDIVVYTPYTDPEAVIYVFAGAEGGVAQDPDWTWTREASRGSVAGAGDANGDGYADFLIAAAYEVSSLDLAYGSASNAPDSVALQTEADLDIRFVGASAGDFDGDGFDDVVVAKWSEYTRDPIWEVSCLPGAPTGPGSAIATLTGPGVDTDGDPSESYYDYGLRVAPAGDVNADGFDDALVGAPEDNWQGGRAFLYLGG